MSNIDKIIPPSIPPSDKNLIEDKNKKIKKTSKTSSIKPLSVSPLQGEVETNSPMKFTKEARNITLKPKPKNFTKSKDDLVLLRPQAPKSPVLENQPESQIQTGPKVDSNLQQRRDFNGNSSLRVVPSQEPQRKVKNLTKEAVVAKVPKPQAPKSQEEHNVKILGEAARIEGVRATPLPITPVAKPIQKEPLASPHKSPPSLPTVADSSVPAGSHSPLNLEIPGYINFIGRFFTPEEYKKFELGPGALSVEKLREISARTPESLRSASPDAISSPRSLNQASPVKPASPISPISPKIREIQSDSMFVNLILDEAAKHGGIRKQEVLWYHPSSIVESFLIDQQDIKNHLLKKNIPQKFIDSIPNMALDEYREKIAIPFGSGSCGATANILEDLLHPQGDFRLDRAKKQEHVAGVDHFVKRLESLVEQHRNENWFCRIENVGGHSFLIEYNKGKYQIHQSFFGASTAAENLLKNQTFSVQEFHQKLKIALGNGVNAAQAKRELFSSESLSPDSNGFDIRILLSPSFTQVKQRLENMSEANDIAWKNMGKKKMSEFISEHEKIIAAADKMNKKLLEEDRWVINEKSVTQAISTELLVPLEGEYLTSVKDLKPGELYTVPRDSGKYAYEFLEITKKGEFIFEKKKQSFEKEVIDERLKNKKVFELDQYGRVGQPALQLEKGKPYSINGIRLEFSAVVGGEHVFYRLP